MKPGDHLGQGLVLLLGFSQQDGDAIMRAMGDAGVVMQLCSASSLSPDGLAGVGAIVLAEEAMSESVTRQLATLVEEQPIWSDLPFVILTMPKRETNAHWRSTRNARSIRNATLLERPLRIATLLQAVKVALRGREKQYRLRNQMREREQLQALAERNERRLSVLLNNTRMAVFFMDDRQHCTFMNAAAEDLTGYGLAEMRGRPLHDIVHHTHPDGSQYLRQDCPIDCAFPESSHAEGEDFFVHKDGHFYPVAFAASPILLDNVVVGTVLEVSDITKRKADSERLHMMMNELNHRVKNSLVTVQSIFVQTLQGDVISDAARDRIMSRLMALARSHDVLTENSWVSAPLREVAYRALAPFGAAEHACGRFSISGSAFELQPMPSLAIAMALHELATNAVKYGALGVEGGTVDLSWNLIHDNILRLRWVEQGGPSVEVPQHIGFGRRLIERGLAHELGGKARFSFHRAGVICEIDVPGAAALVATENRMTDAEKHLVEWP